VAQASPNGIEHAGSVRLYENGIITSHAQPLGHESVAATHIENRPASWWGQPANHLTDYLIAMPEPEGVVFDGEAELVSLLGIGYLGGEAGSPEAGGVIRQVMAHFTQHVRGHVTHRHEERTRDWRERAPVGHAVGC